jgi:hypothetical protein
MISSREVVISVCREREEEDAKNDKLARLRHRGRISNLDDIGFAFIQTCCFGGHKHEPNKLREHIQQDDTRESCLKIRRSQGRRARIMPFRAA